MNLVERSLSRLFTKSIRVFTLLFHVFLLSACGPQIGKRAPQGEWLTVVSGDSISKYAEEYKVPLVDIIEINGLRDPSRILVGQKIFIPYFNRSVGYPDSLPTKVRSKAPSPSYHTFPGFRALKGAPLEAVQGMTWPLKLSLKSRIGLSSPFGLRKGKAHKGLDIKAPIGTHIRAALAGDVIRSEMSHGGYGWVIYIRHAGGLETRYAHNHKNLVKEGGIVRAGDIIAEVGNTGRSSGPHLHFELRINGAAVDPLLFLPAQ